MSEPRKTVSTLTKKQQIFVEHYLQCWNETEAARLAGYKWPNKQASRLMQEPTVQERIALRTAEIAMSADEVLARLAKHARGDMLDFVAFQQDSDGNILDIEPELSLHKARKSGAMGLIKEIWHDKSIHTDKDGNIDESIKMKIKLYDAQAALVHLGRYHALFTDKQEVESREEVVSMTVEEWREEQARRRNEAAETATLFNELDTSD